MLFKKFLTINNAKFIQHSFAVLLNSKKLTDYFKRSIFHKLLISFGFP